MLTDGSLLISSSEYKLIWAQQLLSLTLSLEIRNQSGLVRSADKNAEKIDQRILHNCCKNIMQQTVRSSALSPLHRLREAWNDLVP